MIGGPYSVERQAFYNLGGFNAHEVLLFRCEGMVFEFPKLFYWFISENLCRPQLYFRDGFWFIYLKLVLIFKSLKGIEEEYEEIS